MNQIFYRSNAIELISVEYIYQQLIVFCINKFNLINEWSDESG